MTNFAIYGAAGYIAPRHMQAIRGVGGDLLCAYDMSDSIGILDQWFPDAEFINSRLALDSFLAKSDKGIDYAAICTPNYLHDAHSIDALRRGASVICEKPLVTNLRGLDKLREVEALTGERVYTIMQLRLDPSLIALRKRIRESAYHYNVVVNYVTPRGRWYANSWKGNKGKSGGLAFNIGIHLFDLMLFLFGEAVQSHVYISDTKRMSGFLSLERANVAWLLSIDRDDLLRVGREGESADRTLYISASQSLVDGEEISLSNSFADLHTESYKEIVAGRGFGIDDAERSITLAHLISEAPITAPIMGRHHPYLISLF